jgi:hypothetical protein
MGRMTLVAYPLVPSGEVEQGVLDVAARSHLLVFGELHGTREIPSLMAGLLPGLARLGYRGLALEVPRDQRDALLAWADGQTDRPPPFYARPSRGGRGSVEMLELVKSARGLGLEVLCFDQTAEQPMPAWSDRDRWMAYNLLDSWALVCGGQRVVAVCGSLHARLVPDAGLGRMVRKAVSGGQQLWPSLAGWIQQQQPGLVVSAVDVRFGGGAYFNMGERSLYSRPGSERQARVSPAEPAFTLALRLPRATPATFLAEPD